MPERKDQDRHQQKHDHKHEHRHENRHEHKHEREQHERRYELPRARYPTPPQFRAPQNFYPQYQNHHNHFDYRNHTDARRYQQHHFRNPYDGSDGVNNFWRDRWDDNYYRNGDRYFDGHRQHHHHHRHKDDFFPRLLEGIVGGILSGSLIKEFDKLDFDEKPKSTKKNARVEDIDDNDIDSKPLRREMFTPDQQILLNLDMHSQLKAADVDARFERTG